VGDVAQLGREVASQLRLMRRSPFAVVVTVALPLLLVPLLHSLHEGELVFLSTKRPPLRADQYFVPAAAAFAVASACFAQLAVRTTSARESGVLKRVRGTPASPAAHLAARVVALAVIAVTVVAAGLVLGAVAYDLELRSSDLPAALGITLLGAGTFSALGLAASRAARTADAANAVAYAVLVPLALVSSTFITPGLTPRWMSRLGAALPLEPFTRLLVRALDPAAAGSIHAWDLGRLVGWGVAATVVAAATFSWLPAAERTRR
jgi:ABC-type multidrug transport system permease subunit